jgi:hypothetical protein
MAAQNSWLRYGSMVMLLAFILSTAVQFNDPDSLLWIAIYSASALCCLAYLLGKNIATAAGALALLALLWALSLLPAVVGHASLSEVFASISMQTRAVEEAREIGGLLLVAGWMGLLGLKVRAASANEH